MSAIQLHPAWRDRLGDVFEQDFMVALRAFLVAERAAGRTIFPAANHWFAALDACPPDAVRVVIIGQDPYHGPGQAHGLSFSVPRGVRMPPSLTNIYKEIRADLGIATIPAHGNLDHWAAQGVLLLNSVLTVEAGKAASHQGRGWEQFTDRVIASLANLPQPIAFLLWGSYAQRKAAQVRENGPHPRLVLRAPHPSPLSAHHGWFGSKHFSAANAFLERYGAPPIQWL